MLRSIAICSKCKEQTLVSDEGEGMLVFDFIDSEIRFFCPKCNKESYFNLGEIQTEVKRQTKLPGISSASF
ncbi:MAG TPA: hypothetical protein VMZ91_04935 [Candidatus Paceibacterota bacterium]|nr:hypothetical protein [Candidatus Paceibacterota bacterium]